MDTMLEVAKWLFLSIFLAICAEAVFGGLSEAAVTTYTISALFSTRLHDT